MMACALVQRSSCSFTTDDPEEIAEYLSKHGYSRTTTRSPHEYCRLMKDGSIVVVFLSGAVLVQGKQIDTTVAWLISQSGGLF